MRLYYNSHSNEKQIHSYLCWRVYGVFFFCLPQKSWKLVTVRYYHFPCSLYILPQCASKIVTIRLYFYYFFILSPRQHNIRPHELASSNSIINVSFSSRQAPGATIFSLAYETYLQLHPPPRLYVSNFFTWQRFLRGSEMEAETDLCKPITPMVVLKVLYLSIGIVFTRYHIFIHTLN